MTDKRWTQLPTVLNSTLNDITCAVQAGVSTQQTLQQFYNLFLANTILSSSGNPNGSTAGTTYQLCWDTIDQEMYVCTVSGNSTGAIWVVISSEFGGVVPATQGGTGVVSPTQYTLPIAQGSSPFNFVSLTNGQILIGSTGASPVVGTISGSTNIGIANTAGAITLSLAGIVSATLGGTGVSVPTPHGIAVGEGASPFNFIPLTDAQVLIGMTGSDPVASTLTAGDGISIDNLPGEIIINSLLGSPVTPTQGGTGVSNPTAHAIAIAEGESNFTFQTLTDGQILIGSTGADPVAAILSAGVGIGITGGSGSITIASVPGDIISPSYGGTGVADPTTGGIAIGEGLLDFNFITLSDGQLLIGSTGVDPVPTTLTAGSGISITNASGSITVAATGAGDLLASNNLSDVANTAASTINLFTPYSVTTTATLPTSVYGSEVICTGGSGYTVTLPTGSGHTNQFIDICSHLSSGTVLTLSPASGTIAGQSVILLGSGDAIRLITDGTNWWILSQWLQPVNFETYLSAPFSVADSTSTLVAYDTLLRNIGGGYNTGTSLFTPPLPGLYDIYTSNAFVPTTTISLVNQEFFINKNGSGALNIVSTLPVGTNSVLGQMIVGELYGTVTDTFSVNAFQQSGGALNLDNTQCYFGAKRVSLF